MANVTIKDIDDDAFRDIAERADALGMSTQEYLRRLIAREAGRPHLPDELAELAARTRSGRTPMSMDEFDSIRRAAIRPT
jgi:negative regulator of replication initiation